MALQNWKKFSTVTWIQDHRKSVESSARFGTLIPEHRINSKRTINESPKRQKRSKENEIIGRRSWDSVLAVDLLVEAELPRRRRQRPRKPRRPHIPAPSSSSSSNRSFGRYPRPRGPRNVFFYTLHRIVYILDNLGSLARDTCLVLIFTALYPVFPVACVISWLVVNLVGICYFICMRILVTVTGSKTQDSHADSQNSDTYSHGSNTRSRESNIIERKRSKARLLWNGYMDWRKKKCIFGTFGGWCFVLCLFYGSGLYGFWRALILDILGPAFDT